MSEKILVASATKAGSTAEVAEGVAEKLRDAGPEADVPSKDVKDLGASGQ